MKTIVSLLALLAFVPLAPAQTVYEPVRYQFGAHGEIYYGGNNPIVASNPYLFVPDSMSRQSDVRQTLPSPYYVNTGAGGGFYAFPNYQPTFFHPQYLREPDRAIFSDLSPYTEVGRYGYTIDDARNEAYSNVPLYQTKQPDNQQPQVVVAAPPEPVVVAPTAPADPRLKAIPLLDWAKGAHARHQDKLVNALLEEAAKYDPVATKAVRDSFTAGAKKPTATATPVANER